MDPKNFQNSPTGQAIRTPTGYWTFVPNPLPPEINWTPELVSALSRADRSLTELAGLGHAFPNPYVQVRPFVRRY